MTTAAQIQSPDIFRRIIVPHDLSTRCHKAVEWAAKIANPHFSEVVLVHVIDPKDRPPSGDALVRGEGGAMARDRWRRLQVIAREFLPAGLKFELHLLSGQPQEVIMNMVQASGGDLLIVTHHPTLGAGYPFHDNDIEKVANLAPCPVLAIPVSVEEEATLADREMNKVQTHNLSQYCDFSRFLARKNPDRPVFIGYSVLPPGPKGVCH